MPAEPITDVTITRADGFGALPEKQKQHSVPPLLHAFEKPDENNGPDIPTDLAQLA